MGKVDTSYYSNNSDSFISSTKDCDMNELYYFFEKHLKNAKTILDLGFGSGRDSLYFSKKYEVYSLDPTIEFCEYGKLIGLKNVINISAQEMEFDNQFDGIWACASLLHIPSNELNDVFKKCSKALKNNGVLYCSFKLGDFEGMRNERYYLDINESSIKEFLLSTNLLVKETLITKDVRDNREDKWINFLLQKSIS